MVFPRVMGGLDPFTQERTVEMMRSAKKLDSRVNGDLLAHLVRLYPEAFAIPLQSTTRSMKAGTGQQIGRLSILQLSPKTPNPSGLTECRNISCTSIFSKILEGAVLAQLRKELAPDPCQYGGIPKCGADNLLVDI